MRHLTMTGWCLAGLETSGPGRDALAHQFMSCVRGHVAGVGSGRDVQRTEKRAIRVVRGALKPLLQGNCASLRYTFARQDQGPSQVRTDVISCLQASLS